MDASIVDRSGSASDSRFQLRMMGSAGSGVLIAPDSRVLTATHLIEGAEKILVKMPNGESSPASIGHINGFREFSRLYDGTIAAEFIQTDAAINSGSSARLFRNQPSPGMIERGRRIALC